MPSSKAILRQSAQLASVPALSRAASAAQRWRSVISLVDAQAPLSSSPGQELAGNHSAFLALGCSLRAEGKKGTQWMAQVSCSTSQGQRLSTLEPASTAMSTAYHPQADGRPERMTRILENCLRHLLPAGYNESKQHQHARGHGDCCCLDSSVPRG